MAAFRRAWLIRVAVQQIRLHSEIRIHPLQAPVLVLDGLHLADQGRIHSTILCPPLVKRRAAHPMLTAQLDHRHPAFGLPQDCEDLSLSASACLHLEFLRSSCRENSTYAAPYFLGVPRCAGSLSEKMITGHQFLTKSDNARRQRRRGVWIGSTADDCFLIATMTD